jgi:hypothetical protein
MKMPRWINQIIDALTAGQCVARMSRGTTKQQSTASLHGETQSPAAV